MHSLLNFLLEFLVVIALVLANGFFVAAEFALVKVRASQLRPLAKKGGWRVRFAVWANGHLGAILSATQLGVTLASLGLGWVGEPLIAHRLAPWLGRLGVMDPAVVSSIAFGSAFTVITFIHIIFGELGPKAVAIQKARTMALWTSAPMVIFYYCFFPFIWLLNNAANVLLGWFGFRPAGESDHGIGAMLWGQVTNALDAGVWVSHSMRFENFTTVSVSANVALSQLGHRGRTHQ